MTRTIRSRFALLALALVPVLGACEDPIIFVGDLPGIMRIAAGTGRIGEHVDSLARATEMRDPRGIALGSDGTLYIADSRNSRILAVRATGRLAVLSDSSLCVDVCLEEPRGIAVASDGSLWITDPVAHRIFRIDPLSPTLEVRAGTGVPGNSPDGTGAIDAQLNAPHGIAIANGLVYFTERLGHRVRWITNQGSVRTLAGTGEQGFGEGSPATNAKLDSPEGLAAFGNLLYVADTQNDRVRVINISGNSIRTIAGNGVNGYADTDTVASTAKLGRPRALAVSPDGEQLYIADGANDRVRVVHLDENRIATFAGDGDAVFDGEGLDAAQTSLDDPSGLAMHPDGILFIADTGHYVVWRTRLRF